MPARTVRLQLLYLQQSSERQPAIEWRRRLRLCQGRIPMPPMGKFLGETVLQPLLVAALQL